MGVTLFSWDGGLLQSILQKMLLPLTDLLSSSRTFIWSPSCENALKVAKDLMCFAPVLAAPDFSRPFKLEVDASAVGAAAIIVSVLKGNLQIG